MKEGDINTKPIVVGVVPQLPVESDSDSDADDAIPIAAVIARDAPEPESDEDGGDTVEPPLGKRSEQEEVAFDFGDPYGICVGAITDYDGDFYQVTYDDGEYADFDQAEYVAAWHLARSLHFVKRKKPRGRRKQRAPKKKKKTQKKKKKKTAPPTPPATVMPPSAQYTVGDIYSFKLTDESFKGPYHSRAFFLTFPAADPVFSPYFPFHFKAWSKSRGSWAGG